jgi:hypothetical protein
LSADGSHGAQRRDRQHAEGDPSQLRATSECDERLHDPFLLVQAAFWHGFEHVSFKTISRRRSLMFLAAAANSQGREYSLIL